MIKNIKAFFLHISRESCTFAPHFKNITTMTKKKSELEQALSDFRKTQKEQRNIVSDMERIIRRKEREIRELNDQLKSLKAEYEAKCQEIFGTNMDSYLQGVRFEQHVAWWMREYFPQYSLKIWQGDKYYKPYEEDEPITAEWNSFPDLIYVDEDQKKVLAIECKYRKDGKLTIEEKQYNNYKQSEVFLQNLFGAEVKVLVMAGIDEFRIRPNKPDYMYCFPIDFFKDGKEKELKSFKEYLVMDRYHYANTKPIIENIHF